ncbi:hypothetical protein HPP92_027011 [Vanilla planifolia]|uniref:DYW domain-containing protein n=1 Tax=Vanilla planifolia TaxID=51239 RepID=A0A835U550_VANPL|nr:hypothetical protein HPP92_027011 [Vanilla planifolia]
MPEEAVRAYLQMRREGVVCNENSYAAAISSCGFLDCEMLSRKLLSHVVVAGFEAEVSVGNSLVTIFGNMGKVGLAEKIFHRMNEWDTISWNSLISVYSREGMYEEAFGCFSKMRFLDFKPDVTTLSCLISTCDSVDLLSLGRGVHAFAVKSDLESFTSVNNTLLGMYSLSGKHKDAEHMFSEMPMKDIISWNTMMSLYSQSGSYNGTSKVLSEMLRLNKQCNHVTFATALAACASHEALPVGTMVHALSILSGLQDNLMVGNCLLTMYSKCNAMREAEKVFQTMPNCDVITWNTLIGGYVENEEMNEAIQAFNQMREAGVMENYITVVNILGVCSSAQDLKNLAKPLHGHVILIGLETNGFVQNSLITMYANCDDFDSSGFIFHRMSSKSVVSWNAMIVSKAHQGHGEEAMKYFKEMFSSGVELDQFSLSGGLSGCACLASNDGQQLHCLIIKLGFDSNLHVVNAAMDMYGKCGKMDDFLKLLPEPSDRSRVSWNIMISCYARHGHLMEAEHTFNQMLLVGPKPDYVTFVSLLSACSHAGLVDKGRAYYKLMISKFGMYPRIEHCVCMVDLLGRAGRLAEAEKFIENMPLLPNGLIWRSLLSSCRTHRNLDIGQKAAEHLLHLEPLDDSAYVLLSNAYALSGKWKDAEKWRTRMKLIALKKKPACSWIKVKNEVITFGIADKTHPKAKEIDSKLKWILQLIKEAGYSVDTSQSLHDTDEEQQEYNLWNHSEKLALAFGIMFVPDECPITVFKNLRVCGDCHLVYKLVSRLICREIILRDSYRFHHFRGGTCTCSDYW